MDNVTIVRQYQTQDINPQGRVDRVIVIDFNVGTDGPFSVRIPFDQYTAAFASAAVQQLALEIMGTQKM